jgi:hypothetical protein
MPRLRHGLRLAGCQLPQREIAFNACACSASKEKKKKKKKKKKNETVQLFLSDITVRRVSLGGYLATSGRLFRRIITLRPALGFSLCSSFRS